MPNFDLKRRIRMTVSIHAYTTFDMTLYDLISSDLHYFHIRMYQAVYKH